VRILHVNKFFDLRDGTDIYLHGLMERQKSSGHEPHVLATRASTNAETPDAHLFTERLDYARREAWSKDARKAAAFIWNREAARAMTEALREYRPEVIHLHNIYHHLTTSILRPIRASGIPCVQTLHDYKLACPNYKMFTEGAPCERCRGGRYYEAVRHHCLAPSFAANALAMLEMNLTKATQAYEKSVDYFLCPAQFMANKMRDWGEPPSKLRYLPNPVELPTEVADGSGSYILYIGRLSAEKGVEVLIRAAAAVPECKLKLAGSGPEEQKLRALARSLGADNIEFFGFVRKPELKEKLRQAAALAIPSVWYENAPLVVLEAMAMRLPVLAADIGGLPEMVESGKNGLLLKPGSVPAWTEGLRKFLALSADERSALGEAGRRRVEENFTWELHLERLGKVYREAIRSS